MSLLTFDFAGIKKIISGGQVGVDQGALEGALDCRIETGGWAPAGYRTTTGSNKALKERYNLKEHSSRLYPPRTRQNVVDSDGTLIIAFNPQSAGTALTVQLCKKLKKPFLLCVVDLKEKINIDRIAAWITENNISTLNVAGNHERAAEMFSLTRSIICALISKLNEN
jgi:hypothetical protein